MKPVTVKIDGISLNASHYAKMGEEKAVKDMMQKDENGTGPAAYHGKDAVWAKSAFAACEKAVKDAEAKEAAKKKAALN